MPLPPFTETGDLPEGIHPATLQEIIDRFGRGATQRVNVTARLCRIIELATTTGSLERLILFGSYITAKPSPNDIDVVLVMRDDFNPLQCSEACQAVFDHRRASAELGASCFWVRPGMLFGEPLDQFIAGWGVRREGGRRGIVEVQHDCG